ncbi:hypothetical protein BLA29_010255, partial [Euroglyphus maynei]
MLTQMRTFDQLVKYIDKLYEEALYYDYTRFEKVDDGPKKPFRTAAISTNFCYVCSKNHESIFECLPNYDTATIIQIIRSKGLCFNCLKRGHLGRDCPLAKRDICSKCSKFHNTEMHDVIYELFQTIPKVVTESNPAQNVSADSSCIDGSVVAISSVSTRINVFDVQEIPGSDNRPIIH